MTLGGRPRIVGILNVTPDSFSDGGAYFDVDRAVAHGEDMAALGADMIDVGGVSTRPGSTPVDEATEIERIEPVIARLGKRVSVPIAIDTFRAAVLERAVDVGATVLNDVTALRGDPRMAATVATTRVGCVLMHMLGEPKTMQTAPRYDDVCGDIIRFLADAIGRAVREGVAPEALAVDPGIGFGKTVAHNLEILRRAHEFHVLGRPLYFGASRKSFLGKLLDRPDPARREWATAATTAHLFGAGAHFIRVHDVGATADLVRILDAVRNGVSA